MNMALNPKGNGIKAIPKVGELADDEAATILSLFEETGIQFDANEDNALVFLYEIILSNKDNTRDKKIRKLLDETERIVSARLVWQNSEKQSQSKVTIEELSKGTRTKPGSFGRMRSSHEHMTMLAFDEKMMQAKTNGFFFKSFGRIMKSIEEYQNLKPKAGLQGELAREMSKAGMIEFSLDMFEKAFGTCEELIQSDPKDGKEVFSEILKNLFDSGVTVEERKEFMKRAILELKKNDTITQYDDLSNSIEMMIKNSEDDGEKRRLVDAVLALSDDKDLIEHTTAFSALARAIFPLLRHYSDGSNETNEHMRKAANRLADLIGDGYTKSFALADAALEAALQQAERRKELEVGRALEDAKKAAQKAEARHGLRQKLSRMFARKKPEPLTKEKPAEENDKTLFDKAIKAADALQIEDREKACMYIADILSKAGRKEQALKLLGSILENGYFRVDDSALFADESEMATEAERLSAIGISLSLAGDAEKAKEIFSRAMEIVEQVKEDSGSRVNAKFLRSSCIRAIARAGDTPEARAEFIKFCFQKSGGFLSNAGILAEAAANMEKHGLFPEAVETYKRARDEALENKGKETWDLGSIVAKMKDSAKSSLLDSAIEYFMHNTRESEFPRAEQERVLLGTVNKALDASDEFERTKVFAHATIDTALMIKRQTSREAISLNWLVNQLVKFRGTEKEENEIIDIALEAAQKHWGKYEIAAVASRLIEKGRLAEAEECLEPSLKWAESTIEYWSEHGESRHTRDWDKLTEVAQVGAAISKLGKTEKAMQILKAASDTCVRYKLEFSGPYSQYSLAVMGSIVMRMANSGHDVASKREFMRLAVETALDMRPSTYTQGTLIALAEFLGEQGMVDEAKTLLLRDIDIITVKDAEKERYALSIAIGATHKCAGNSRFRKIEKEDEMKLLEEAIASDDLQTARIIGMQNSISEIRGLLERFNVELDSNLAKEMFSARLELSDIFKISSEEKRLLFEAYSKEARRLLSGDKYPVKSFDLLNRIIYNLDKVDRAYDFEQTSALTLLLDFAGSLKPGDKRVGRLLSTLVDIESPVARDVALRMIGAEEIQPIHAKVVIDKLLKAKYLDPKIKEIFSSRLRSAAKEDRAQEAVGQVELCRKIIRILGIPPDSELLKLFYDTDIKYKSGEAAITFEEKVSAVNEMRQDFEKILDKDELAEVLAGDELKRMVFYVLYGPSTKFALINDYTSEKFKIGLEKAIAFKLQEGPLEEFMSLVPESRRLPIRSRLLAGKNPISTEKLAMSVEISVSSAEKLESLKEQARGLFGSAQLGIILKASSYVGLLRDSGQTELVSQIESARGMGVLEPIIAEAERLNPELPRLAEKKLSLAWDALVKKNMLQVSLFEALNSQENEINLKLLNEGIEARRKERMQALRNMIRSSKDNDEKKRLVEWRDALDTKDSAKVLRFMIEEALLTVRKNDRREPTELETAILAEWGSHLDAFFQGLQEANYFQRDVRKTKKVVVRLLDKRDDLIESLRFADAEQCCFRSTNYEFQELGGIGSADWIAMMWKDPLSFVFLIENDAPGTKQKNAVGFVFGSYGMVDGELAVLLNGVYLNGKTNSAAQKILAKIEQEFARPMGAKTIIIATKYGGKASYDGYSNEKIRFKRLRALSWPETGKLITGIYDDLATTKDNNINVESETDKDLWHKKL